MIFGVGFDVINIANRLQISISQNTKVGQRIKRENTNEFIKDASGTPIIKTHPDHNFLIELNTNYCLFNGHIKMRYTWDENSVFQDEHKDIYRNVLAENHKSLAATFDENDYVHGEGFMEHQNKHQYRYVDWHTPALHYEPYSTTAEVEIMQNGTVILCPMQHQSGWTFEHIHINPRQSIESRKQGSETYIVFGERCSTGGKNIEKHSTKKQTSSLLKITNESPAVCTLVRIHR